MVVTQKNGCTIEPVVPEQFPRLDAARHDLLNGHIRAKNIPIQGLNCKLGFTELENGQNRREYRSLRVVRMTIVMNTGRMNRVPRFTTIPEPSRAPVIWPAAITIPGSQRTIPTECEHDEGDDVAREVHDLRVAGGLPEIESETQNECDRPEGSHTRSEETVVEPEQKSEDHIVDRAGHPGPGHRTAEVR